MTDTLRPGQTLGEMFGAYGLTGTEMATLIDAVRRFESPRRLRPGTVVTVAVRAASPPSRISLQLDADRLLHLFPSGASGPWEARLDSVPVVRDTIVLGGVVRSNLYGAELFGDVNRLAPGERQDLIFRLSRVFAWQIDFYRDVRQGDRYRVAIAREVRPDGSVRRGEVLAARYEGGRATHTAVRFRPSDGDEAEYFDPRGEALRSQFLRAPLAYGRVTSRFNLRRYHPILKRRRPHLGTDYGAPSGTPVRATGAGVVTRAGTWGGYGRVVELRHANGLRTRYAHLRGLARGMRSGRRVEQGQTLGYVGATGLATAPHLHYEFLRGGRQVDPAALDLPRAEPVPTDDRPRFAVVRDEALRLLARLDPVPWASLALADETTDRADD